MASTPLNRLYLASQSPRRLALLRQIGYAPEVLLPEAPVDETPYSHEPARDYVLRLAQAKAAAGEATRRARSLPEQPVLAADTTVTLDGLILGKPTSADAAAAMLRRYAGRSHTVFTAVCVRLGVREACALSESEVHFRALGEAEIAAYVASSEPFDKAGGYGIQGRAAAFVEHLAGSHSGVMGLPLCDTARLLQAFGRMAA